MQLFTLVAFAAVWSLLGGAALAWIGEKDRVRLALLGPVAGLAIAALAVSSASLLGFSIQVAAWPLIFLSLVGIAAAFFRRGQFNWRLIGWILGLTAGTAALSIVLVGRSLMDVGTLWQGLMNEDAATNALAAQYFIQHPFFALLDASVITSGTDYSPLATSIYVASGHRFADVMLLGLSAVLTGLQPDQVYMAHALFLRVALIMVCASLVYDGRQTMSDALVAIVVLSVSSVGSYNYLNQLISQTGGIAFMVLTLILWVRLLDIEREKTERKRTVLLLAIVAAALLRSYPEVAPLLGVAMLVSVLIVAPRYDAAAASWTLSRVLATGALVAVVSNASLPHSITHVLNTLSIGNVQNVQAKGLMDYAFTPDVFPLLFGFIRFRQVLADPWAAFYVAGGCMLVLSSLWAAWRFRGTYVALAAILAALCVTFGVLWVKGEEFGTFKAMLFLQPFVCVTVTVVLAKLASKSDVALAALASGFALLNLPVTSSLVQSAATDIYPLPTLIRADILNAIESTASAQTETVLDLQSFLLQQFVTLRQKAAPTYFATDPPGPITDRFEGSLATYHATFHREWFDSYQTLKRIVNERHRQAVTTVAFGCGPEPVRSSTFEMRSGNTTGSRRAMYAGGAVQPFNRARYSNQSLITAQPGNADRLVAQRESSLGRWEVSAGPRNGERSVFFAELDPMGQVATMSAVGRYVLLEVLAPGVEPTSLRMAFSRSFFGAAGAALPRISVHGASSVSVAGRGAGAIDITSPPVMPCVVAGRSYLMIDFGTEPEVFKKIPPLLYRTMGIRYVPDARRSVGFLRDISISNDAVEASTFQPKWSPKDSKGGAVLGYEGLFEDGWLSGDARVVVRAEPGQSGFTLNIELDPALLPVGTEPPEVLIRDNFGNPVAQKKLAAGINVVRLPIPSSGIVDVRLISERTLELPGGDGRRVFGRLTATALE